MKHAAGLVTGHHIQIYRVDTVENAALDIRVVAAQTAQQNLDLLPLGTAAAVVAHRAVFGEAARALDKFEVVILLPREDILLVNAVQRTNQLHACKVGAVQLGQHGLHLRAIKHTHDGGFDDIVEVVAERDLVAAKLLRLAVQIAAAHARTQVARVLLAAVGNRENIGLEHGDRDMQQCGVALNFIAVDLVVAGVHNEENYLKRHLAVPLEQLHQLGHQHGILAAGDAHGNLVARLNQLILTDRQCKRVPDGLAEFFDDTALDQLVRL